MSFTLITMRLAGFGKDGWNRIPVEKRQTSKEKSHEGSHAPE
jgi:hypothetical protein